MDYDSDNEQIIRPFEGFISSDRQGQTGKKTYSSYAINALNSVYYSSCPDAFTPDSGLSNLYANNNEVHVTFGTMFESIRQQLGNPNVLFIKEISSGSTVHRWNSILQQIHTGVDIKITLTDFSKASLPMPRQLEEIDTPHNIQIETRIEDILQPLEYLPPEQRHDIIFATYAFDSYLGADDLTVQKIDGEWYIEEYHLQVRGFGNNPDSISREQRLIAALELGRSPDGKPIALEDLQKVYIEKSYRSAQEDEVPYLDNLETRFPIKSPPINIPGHLIQFVEEAFEKQLTDDGVIIIGDVALSTEKGFAPKYDSSFPEIPVGVVMMDIGKTGKVAWYKMLDFFLAQQVLRNRGYYVEIKNLSELGNDAGQTIPVNDFQKVITIRKVLDQ